MNAGYQTEIKTGIKLRGISVLFFIIRVLLGGMMLEEGLNKLFSGNFSASDFLLNGTGPFSGWYAGMAPYVSMLDPVVIWTQILIGIALFTGVLVRFVSFWAAVMMVLFYLAYVPSPLGWVNYQLIYAVLFVGNIFTGAGYFLGFDRLFYKLEVKKHPLRLLFG